ncbi:MAG: hypothetical protein N2235_23350 [Fischerella sp.]|nr:hypothetical protein [Fischerella sp.]
MFVVSASARKRQLQNPQSCFGKPLANLSNIRVSVTRLILKQSKMAAMPSPLIPILYNLTTDRYSTSGASSSVETRHIPSLVFENWYNLFASVKQNNGQQQQAGEAHTKVLLTGEEQKAMEQSGFPGVR